MAEVTIMVGGKNYAISCEDGEEAHLRELAAQVDGKVRELRQSVAQAGDLRLILMAALLLADETVAIRQKFGILEQRVAELAKQNEDLSQRLVEAEESAFEALETTARQAEDIAARLARA